MKYKNLKNNSSLDPVHKQESTNIFKLQNKNLKNNSSFDPVQKQESTNIVKIPLGALPLPCATWKDVRNYLNYVLKLMMMMIFNLEGDESICNLNILRLKKFSLTRLSFPWQLWSRHIAAWKDRVGRLQGRVPATSPPPSSPPSKGQRRQVAK